MKLVKLKMVLIFILIFISSYFYITPISYAKESTVDSVISGAESFISNGEKEKKGAIDEKELHNTSNIIYNLLLAIAMIVAVAVGSALGIKFMISSVEEKANIKELLVPYIAGCIVVFGAFGIWKIAVNIFKNF